MGIRKLEFESPLPHKIKPAPVAGFIIYEKNSVSSVSKAIAQYRKPEIVKAKHGWYIKYYYRIPAAIRNMHDNKSWLGFRVKEDMNRRKGADREEYAVWLRDQIELSLKNGYNPFFPELEHINPIDTGTIEVKEMSISSALKFFIEKWSSRGLEGKSLDKYKRYINRLIDWLIEKQIPEIEVSKITTDHLEEFLNDNKRKHDLSNREYNNTMLFLRTAFNYLLKKKIITENPLSGVDKQEARTVKHRYYDTAALKTITAGLEIKDPYMYLIFQTVYHLCIRSEKELMHFRIGNIQWDHDRVFIDLGKGNTQRYIPMDANIKQIFLSARLDEYPSDYYVFGAHNKPAAKHVSHAFFARRFGKARKYLGMNSAYTLYGAKHTRVVHLKQDGATDADIMSLTGHKDFTAYAKYLRDLGMAADAKKLNKLSRKV